MRPGSIGPLASGYTILPPAGSNRKSYRKTTLYGGANGDCCLTTDQSRESPSTPPVRQLFFLSHGIPDPAHGCCRVCPPLFFGWRIPRSTAQPDYPHSRRSVLELDSFIDHTDRACLRWPCLHSPPPRTRWF